jgi:hypothetical protein
MRNRLKTPSSIGEIIASDPAVLTRVVFLAAEVRQRQRAYFANRGSAQALELLTASKEHERLLDIAIDQVTIGGRAAQGDLLG